MKIQLKNWRVKDLSFSSTHVENSNLSKDNNFQLSFGHAFNQEDPREFVIGFKINLYNQEFHLELEMIFVFQTDSKIDSEFKNSPFLRINAPAIAFPYIRSYISNLTLQSGYGPIILPSVNFVSLSEGKR